MLYKNLSRLVEQTLGRAVAFVAGTIMTFVGLAMGVTMIMLPVGVVLGAAGVLLVVMSISPIPR